MKVIEAQSAVLTNYEVFEHLSTQHAAYKDAKRRGPPNLETVVREVLQYLRTQPSPLNQTPNQYSPGCIKELIQKLRPYDLSKGEVVMILNLRPASVAALNTVLEDMADRYSEEQQEEMVGIIADVLGHPDGAAEPQQADGDVSMSETNA